MSSFFITSTGTDIGKTFITQALIHQLRLNGKRVNAFKPLISGYDAAAIRDSDTGKILLAMEEPLTDERVAACSPWRFRAPLSPHSAAELEDTNVDINGLIGWCHNHISEAREEAPCLIEGVGGVMVPLTREHTVIDWMAALEIPAILVVGSYLGTLSHTLTALHALSAKHIEVAGIVITESSEDAMPAEDTREGLRGFIPDEMRVVCVPHAKEGFAGVPDLLSLL